MRNEVDNTYDPACKCNGSAPIGAWECCNFPPYGRAGLREVTLPIIKKVNSIFMAFLYHEK